MWLVEESGGYWMTEGKISGLLVGDEGGELLFGVGLVAGRAGLGGGLLLGSEYAVVCLCVDPLQFLLSPGLVVLHLLLEVLQVLLYVVSSVLLSLVGDVGDFLVLLLSKSGLLLPLAVVGFPAGLFSLCLAFEFQFGVLLGLSIELFCQLAHVICVPDEGQLVVPLVFLLLPLLLLLLPDAVVLDLLQQFLLVFVFHLLAFLGGDCSFQEGFGDCLFGFFFGLLSAVAGVGDLLFQILSQLFASFLIELSALFDLVLVLLFLAMDVLAVLAGLASAFLFLLALVFLHFSDVVVVDLLELLLGGFGVAVFVFLQLAEGHLPAFVGLVLLGASLLVQAEFAVVAVDADQSGLMGVGLGSGRLVARLLGVA